MKVKTSVNLWQLLALGLLLVSGVFFRWWLINLVPQPFIFDQKEYEDYAIKILNAPYWLASHSYRSYPEPMLMAVTYKLFGFRNHQALYAVHAVIDTLTALMVFFVVAAGVRKKTISWIAFIFYIFNPFTSAYVGVGLSEILNAFFITATILCGFYFVRKPAPLIGFLFGFCAGMAAETRNAAFIWAGIPIVLTLLWVHWRRHIRSFVMIAAGLILTMLYPLYTNWRDYHEINFTKVDSFYAMELFNGATLKILPPFTYVYPKAQQDMWYEYWSEYYPNRTSAERRAIALKYYKKAWDIIVADPVDYIRWRFFKMWYVWQKENLFFYVDPGWQAKQPFVYWGNLMLLVLAISGIVAGHLTVKPKEGKWLWAALVGTIVYGVIAFSFSHAEYRLSIPFYPVILSLAAIGIGSVFRFRGSYEIN